MRKFLFLSLWLVSGASLFALPFSGTKECSSNYSWDEFSKNWQSSGFANSYVSTSYFLDEGTFPGTGVGAIPDGGPGCGVDGTALDVTFNVPGLTGAVESVEVDFTIAHTWVGDVTATVIAPDGTTSLVLFGRTGVTATSTCGESSKLGGTYSFTDAAAGGNWWAVSAPLGTSDIIPAGSYRTTEIGPQAANNFSPETSLNDTFGGMADANGAWILRFHDAGGGDTGSVSAANLSIVTEDGGGGTGCEWTVTVSDDENCGDEVSWTLTDGGGNIVLSGGPYSCDVYNDVQSVTAEGPMTFYIESIGSWGDNTPSYEVSNGTEVVASGQLVGGTETTITDLNCDGGGDPGGDPVQGCNDTDIAIATNGVAYTSVISIAEAGTIGTDANLDSVVADIQHTWASDIEMVLISPAGTEVTLTSDNGSLSGLDTQALLTFTDTSANAVTGWDGGAPLA